MVTYLLLAGLLVTLLPSTLATSLYSRDRQDLDFAMKRTAYPLTSVIIHMDVMVKYQAFYMCMVFFPRSLKGDTS